MEKEQILAVVRQANTLLKEKKYADALELLDQLDTDGEEGGLICFMRGNAHMLLEDDQQAHLCYSEALNKGFADKHLFINFAVVKSRLGNLLQAEMLFRQAADLDPTDALPLNRILLLRLARRDFEGAEAVMDELMERNPELVDGYHHKADLLLGTGRPQEALDLLLGVTVRGKEGYERKGMDVYTTVQIPFTTAVFGGEAVVSTLYGSVLCKIRKGMQSGTKIRLKGKGIVSMKDPSVHGDQYVTVQIQVPRSLTLVKTRRISATEEESPFISPTLSYILSRRSVMRAKESLSFPSMERVSFSSTVRRMGSRQGTASPTGRKHRRSGRAHTRRRLQGLGMGPLLSGFWYMPATQVYSFPGICQE